MWYRDNGDMVKIKGKDSESRGEHGDHRLLHFLRAIYRKRVDHAGYLENWANTIRNGYMTTPFPLSRTLEHDPESRNYEHSVRRLVTPRRHAHAGGTTPEPGKPRHCRHLPNTEVLTRDGWLRSRT